MIITAAVVRIQLQGLSAVILSRKFIAKEENKFY